MGLRMGQVQWQEQERVGARGDFLAEGGVYGQGQEPRLTEEWGSGEMCGQ